MGVISEKVLESKNTSVFTFSCMDEIMTEKWGERWLDYRREWKNVNNNRVLSETPLYVVMELNSFCNLRCVMCKHAGDALDVKRKSMPKEMFERVIVQCRELHVPSINIGSGAECTLHPEFKELAMITKESGAIDKFFLTNGSTLSDDMISIIFEGDYERVEISVDAATSETYQKIRRGGNYERLENNILKLLEEKNKRNSKTPIVRLSFCVQKENLNEIDVFYEKWKGKVDIIEYQKMVSHIESNFERSIKTCVQPLNRLTIDYDGNIFPCCNIIYQSEYCLGNISDMTLYEAWHGTRMETLRDSLKKGDLFAHCNQCLLSLYGE